MDCGFPMWELQCDHETDSDMFYTDNIGKRYSYCLVQDWFNCDGFDCVDSAYEFDNNHGLKLWTTWSLSSDLLLTGRDRYEEWEADQDDAK